MSFEFISSIISSLTKKDAPTKASNPVQPTMQSKDKVVINSPTVEDKPITKKIVAKNKNLANVVSFLNKFSNSALVMERDAGLPAIAVLAQLALETGWGQYVLLVLPEDGDGITMIDSNNLFNIKKGSGWNGRVGYRNVWEDLNKDGQKNANEYSKEYFRMYASYADSFKDYASFIKGKQTYAPAVAVANDPVAYVKALQTCGYATDGKYAEKMIQIMSLFEVQG
jgi:flagellar protein FlgJ